MKYNVLERIYVLRSVLVLLYGMIARKAGWRFTERLSLGESPGLSDSIFSNFGTHMRKANIL